jgi:hypothetical protein
MRRSKSAVSATRYSFAEKETVSLYTSRHERSTEVSSACIRVAADPHYPAAVERAKGAARRLQQAGIIDAEGRRIRKDLHITRMAL